MNLKDTSGTGTHWSSSSYDPVDLPALERKLDAYLQRPRQSAETVHTYAKAIKWWRRFCAARGFEAVPTTVEALTALIAAAASGERRETARREGPWSPAALDVILAAISDLHRQHGVIAPHRDPSTDRAICDLMRGYRRQYSRPAKQASPLTIDRARHVLGFEPRPTPDGLATATAMLVAIDTGWGLRAITGLQASDVAIASDGSLVVTAGQDTVDVRCDHAARLPHVPHPCAACHLWTLVCQRLAGPLFAADMQTRMQARSGVLATMGRNWPALHVTPAPGVVTVHLDPNDARAAGTRYGLVMQTRPHGLMTVRSRAIVACAWHTGMRGGSEVLHLQREHIHPDPQGYRITVPRGKSDQVGAGVDRALTTAKDTRLCAVAHMARWLAVRDAARDACPSGQPLFAALRKWGIAPSEALGTKGLHVTLNLLATDCGLDTTLSLHSMRVGFATVAEEQGATLEQRQRALGHAKPETTATYSARRGSRAAHAHLQTRLGEKP